MIVFVGAMIYGGTGAFFNDTETSVGNVFTAGAIDLKVDSQQHYNNMICVENPSPAEGDYYWQPEVGFTPGVGHYPATGTVCDGTWTLTDLGATNKFFNFSDVKPGDQGENTVSLHIDNNPAWACVNIKTTANDENTNIEPEVTAGDNTTGPIGNGELAGNINFQVWLDDGAIDGFGGEDVGEGDNIWQVGEPALASGAMSDIVGNGLTLTLADGGTGNPLPPTVTDYIGMFWCAGDVTGGAGNLGCDGSTMDNTSQTDSVTAEVTFMVEQARNNAAFRCVPPVVPPTATTTITVNKVVVNDNGGTAVVGDFALTVSGIGAVVSGAANVVATGTYDVNETGIGGYAATFGGDCDVDGNVTVTSGQNAVCTITNNDIPASITLNKVVIGGNATTTDFTLRVNGNVVPSGGSVSVNGNSTHTINEDALAGYNFTSITGDAKCPAVLGGATSVLNLAESITCTITNTAEIF